LPSRGPALPRRTSDAHLTLFFLSFAELPLRIATEKAMLFHTAADANSRDVKPPPGVIEELEMAQLELAFATENARRDSVDGLRK
jgi:hypothetical protein